MARGLSRRGVHELPDELVLRAARESLGIPGARGRRSDARPRSLERARLHAERAVPRLRHLQPDGVRQGTPVLRAVALRGGDEMMRRILRAYYARWKLKHVDEEAFREVA